MAVTQAPMSIQQNQQETTTTVIWMTIPMGIPNCPSGLEYLHSLDGLLISEDVNLVELLIGWNCNKTYDVKNLAGQQMYYALEDSSTCARLMCGKNRGFVIDIVDNKNVAILKITRQYKYCAGSSLCAGVNCMAHEILVQTPNGEVMGYARQMFSKCSPHYGVYDASDNLLLEFWGQCCACGCTSDIDFLAHNGDGGLVAKISKTALMSELLSDADDFSISFPTSLDVKVKAVLLGAVFLIDFVYFETSEGFCSS